MVLFALLSQVLVLRELAISVPTFFFQQVQPFFDNIFVAVWDPKQAIREGAVAALRACLILTTQREPKEMQKPQWYRHTFEEAEKGFDETLAKEKGMNRDDRIHGALLILNELVRISSMEGEVRNCLGSLAPGPACQQAGMPLSSQDYRQQVL